ncbi:MAG: DNA-formamidopyrimidine glycosylase family protein [Ilumatobacteraceae bacterium]
MPELPDAAGYRRLLARSLHRIEHVDLNDPEVLRNADRDALDAAVGHQDVRSVERRGKWLVVRVDPSALLIHLGMTGELVLAARHEALDRADRATLHGDVDIRLRDRRRLGGIWLAADADEIGAITGPLGADAARLTLNQLRAGVGQRRMAIKTALTDQAAIAGLGNTLSDEILWVARLHPQTRADALSPEQLTGLHAALRDVVRRAARAGAIPRTPGWLTSQRGVPTPICPRCHGTLRRSHVAGRAALWCPLCQPDGDVSVDRSDPSTQHGT